MKMNSEDVKIKKVIYSNPCTHIIWEDGTKTTSKCDEADYYDELTGFMMCVFKKMFPAKQMRKMFNNYVYGNDKKYIKRDKKSKTPKLKDYEGTMTLEGLAKAMKECRKFPVVKEKPTYNWIMPYGTSWEYVFTTDKDLPAGTYTIAVGHGGI